jgi:hypothetical protein
MTTGVPKKTMQTALELSGRLIALADQAATACDDNNLLVLCGILRDSGYAIRKAVVRCIQGLGREKSVDADQN